MKNKELYPIWKLAKSFWIGGFILWIFETIIFLLIEGWHIKATSKIEIFFDKCVNNIWTAALLMTVCICFHFINNFSNRN